MCQRSAGLGFMVVFKTNGIPALLGIRSRAWHKKQTANHCFGSPCPAFNSGHCWRPERGSVSTVCSLLIHCPFSAHAILFFFFFSCLFPYSPYSSGFQPSRFQWDFHLRVQYCRSASAVWALLPSTGGSRLCICRPRLGARFLRRSESSPDALFLTLDDFCKEEMFKLAKLCHFTILPMLCWRDLVATVQFSVFRSQSWWNLYWNLNMVVP